jgi:Cu/Ag efflux pump CusA
VAQEVKSLAGQTAKATEEISSQIAQMQTATQESVGAIKAIGQTIERISDIATSISAAVEQQRGATQNIAQSVRAAASGTADVAANVRNAAQGGMETGETPSRMFASAHSSTVCGLHEGVRHCEERKRRSNPDQLPRWNFGLLRFARNDGNSVTSAAARSGGTASATSSPAGKSSWPRRR